MITFTRDWRGYAGGSSVGTLEATIEAIAVAEGAAVYGGVAGPLNSSLDGVGKLVGLTGSRGVTQIGGGIGRGIGVDPLAGTLAAAIVTAGSQTGGTTKVVENVTTAEGAGVRISTPSVNGEWAQMTFTLPEPMTIRQVSALIYADTNTQQTLAVYCSTDGAFSASTMISKSITINGSSGLNGAQSNGVPMPYLFGPNVSNAWTNTGSLNLDTALFTHIRIRSTPAAGQYADFTLVRLAINPSRKSRIVITSDDGYKSWFKYALPLLQARGLQCSMAAIHDAIGSSSAYMSEREFREAINNGHEVITHGPSGGGGSLIDNYATTADRVADMVAARANLKARGFFWSQAQERCYVWPQGKFQAAAAATALLDAAKAADFTTARTVSRFIPYSHDVAKTTQYGALLAPIIGHSRQTSSGAEDTEITNITTSIAYAAANGLDAVLMFHHIIADQGTFSTTQSIDIEVSRFITILDAVVTQIAAGKAQNVLFSDLAL